MPSILDFSNILLWSDGERWSDHPPAQKSSAGPIGWPAWAALGAKIGKNRQIEVEKNPIKVSIFDLF